MDSIFGASSPLIRFTSEHNLLLQNDSLDLLVQGQAIHRIYIVSIVGVGRTGKSLIFNLFVAALAVGGYIRNIDSQECRNRKLPNVFKSVGGTDSITHGVDIKIIHLRDGAEEWANGAIVLLDFEGLLNNDNGKFREALSLLLALSTQISQHVLFVDTQFNDNVKTSIGRMVRARLLIENNVVEDWPVLHLIKNKHDDEVDFETITGPQIMKRWFASNNTSDADAQESAVLLNKAFPYGRRTVTALDLIPKGHTRF
jgi:hypothetical protein